MALFVIRSESDLQLIKDLSSKDLVLSLDRVLENTLKERGARYVVPDFSEASKAAVEWMKMWPDRRINGKTFKEMFVYDGMPIWWLMENWLYYSPIWPLRPVLETIAAAKPIMDKTKDEVVFADDGSAVAEAIKLLAGSRARASYKRGLKWKAAAMRLFFDASFMARKLAWGVLSRIYRPANGRAKILFFSVYDWEILRKDGRIVRQDTYIAPLLNHLNRATVKIIGIPVGRFLGLRNIKDKLRSGLKFNVMENYSYNKREFAAALNELQSRWERLKSSQDFVNSFEFGGVNVWPVVSRQFDAYFDGRLKSHIRDYMLLRSLLRTEKPKAVVYPAEMSEFGREIFFLCRKLGIKSLAIQHGVFGNWLNVYHTKQELKGKCRCPMPDVTAVYGTAFRDILVRRCNYPKSAVAVTGAQRFDRITENGADIRKELGIPESKKILALITSPVPRGENEALTKAVFSAAKSFSDTQLVVKIHPNESASVYHDMKRRLASDAIIVRDIDLYDVIRSSSAAMTYLSTAGMEAILLGKPLVVVNLGGRADVVPYVQEKAAIGVYRAEDLKPAIEKALTGKKDSAATSAFIEKYAYKNDGRASERVCKVIRRLINL